MFYLILFAQISLACTLIGEVLNLKGSAYISVNGVIRQQVLENGQFTIEDAAGTVKVESIAQKFPLMTVKCFGKVAKAYQLSPGVEWSPSAPMISLPIQIKPLGDNEYLTPRSSLNIASLLMNPMVLMMLFSGFFMFVQPKLMQGMDKEGQKEVQESQEAVQNLMKGDFAGFKKAIMKE